MRTELCRRVNEVLTPARIFFVSRASHSPCVLLLTLVVKRCLWRFYRLHSLVVIVSTLLTPRTAFQTARTRALHAAHTHQELYVTQTNFVDRCAALPAPLQLQIQRGSEITCYYCIDDHHPSLLVFDEISPNSIYGKCSP